MARPVALVTGASAGIGDAFARALVERGYDLVVTARDEERLRRLASLVGTHHGAAAEVIVADLTTAGGVERVAARLADPAREVDLLVNNAGFGSSGKFWELPVEHEDAQIRCNVVALVRLTHAALGAMVQRGHGGIINVASLGAYAPTPRFATYGATKAFVFSFSNALHEELRGTGVRMMVLAPGFTRTEFHERAAIELKNTPSWMWMTADAVVARALDAFDRGRAVCTPGLLNTATAAFATSFPTGITRRVAGEVVRWTF